jgi:sugar phosphate isomerase/epimerase
VTASLSVDADCLLSPGLALDTRRARRLQGLGIGLVHLRTNGAADVLARLADIVVAEIEPAGFRLGSLEIGLPGQESPASQAADVRGRTLRAIRNACRFAADHGASTVVFTPGSPERGVPYQATLDAGRQTLEQAARYGRDASVRLALATPAPAFLRSPLELQHVIEHLDPIGVALDLDRLVAAGEPFPENWIADLGVSLSLVRLTNPAAVPLDDCLAALTRLGFNGQFVIGDGGPGAKSLVQRLERALLEEVAQ